MEVLNQSENSPNQTCEKTIQNFFQMYDIEHCRNELNAMLIQSIVGSEYDLKPIEIANKVYFIHRVNELLNQLII